MGGGLVKLTASGDGLECEEGTVEVRGGLLKIAVSGAAAKAVKAETDVTLSGGQLILLTTGDAEYDSDEKDISSPAGINCNGNMVIRGASVSAKSTGSAGKGISCDGTLTVSGGTVKIITTGKQYVYGSLDSSPKGIKAEGNLTVSAGTIQVKTTGGEGSEGIESKALLTINGGNIGVYAYDDCMNASKGITIGGGSIYCYSSGNDGIDSNGTLTITGTTSPEEGFDCDQNTFKITGGTLIGIGGSSSTPSSSVSTQRSVLYGGSGSSGTLFTIVASDGTQIVSYQIPRAYQTMTLLFSSAKIASGTTYTIYTGGCVTGGTTFYGMTTGATYTTGTKSTTFTSSSMVTTVGNTSSGGGGGQGGGGRW
jgi:hypothetical protein